MKSPINSFTSKSYKCGSFYIRTSISPDGRFLCSGSSDGHLHVWEIDLPLLSPLLMTGYDEEVTGVSWSTGDLDQVNALSLSVSWLHALMIEKFVSGIILIPH